MKYAIVLMLALVACRGPRGDHGDLGGAGLSGAPGQSIVGPQGPAGIDGTIITVVQFCHNVAPSYPSTFPETGLCINGNLYGVYSANDGFLALLPPGAYNSNAIGSNCNFTILPNCVVQ